METNFSDSKGFSNGNLNVYNQITNRFSSLNTTRYHNKTNTTIVYDHLIESDDIENLYKSVKDMPF